MGAHFIQTNPMYTQPKRPDKRGQVMDLDLASHSRKGFAHELVLSKCIRNVTAWCFLGKDKWCVRKGSGSGNDKTPCRTAIRDPHLLRTLSHLLSSTLSHLRRYSNCTLFCKGFGMAYQDKYQREVKDDKWGKQDKGRIPRADCQTVTAVKNPYLALRTFQAVSMHLSSLERSE